MSRSRSSWSAVGLVVLATATGAVVLAALRGTEPTPAPSPTGSALESPPAVSASPRGTVAARDARIQPVEPLLVVADRTTALLGSTGTCAGGATLEATTDGGATWRPVAVPVAKLLALQVPGPLTVTMVGAGVVDAPGAACTPGVWRSDDGARSWTGPQDAAGSWYRDPQRPARLQTPSGPVPTPCPDRAEPVVELVAVTGTEAALLCRGGPVHRTVDGGRRWVPATAQPGAVALAWQPGGLGWLLADSVGSCPSLTLVRTFDGGSTWQPGGCVGQVPVAVDDVRQPSLDFADAEVGMAVVGGEVFTTRDSGYSWRLAG